MYSRNEFRQEIGRHNNYLKEQGQSLHRSQVIDTGDRQTQRKREGQKRAENIFLNWLKTNETGTNIWYFVKQVLWTSFRKYVRSEFVPEL